MPINVMKCQGCGHHDLEEVLNLGYQPLCNEFLPSDDPPLPQMFYPLCLYHCSQCSLVQLGHVIPTGETFGEQYTYLTGTSRSLIDYYSGLARNLADKLGLVPGDWVIDIGSNDGTFLKAFQSLGMRVLGIEGAPKCLEAALAEGVPTVQRFFGKGISASIEDHIPAGSSIKLITAMNVLAHTDNIGEFIPEVISLMGRDTVFVSSSHWLVELIRKFEFDTIYHEHLRYYTLQSLTNLFKRQGLTIFDAEVTDFYGGSILSYAKTGSPDQTDQLLSILDEESQFDVRESLKSMKQVLLNNKARLFDMLMDLKTSGKRVVGLGAPMKASTLLNFYGITRDLVEYLAEVNPLKIGTDVPGVRIPVLNEEIMFQDQPDYALLLSWNMANFLIPKIRSMGYKGKFILPVPVPEIVG